MIWSVLQFQKRWHTLMSTTQVLWDNTAVLHRATASGSYGSKYVRDMRRTTTKDDSSYAFGENEDHTWEAGISKVKT